MNIILYNLALRKRGECLLNKMKDIISNIYIYIYICKAKFNKQKSPFKRWCHILNLTRDIS